MGRPAETRETPGSTNWAGNVTFRAARQHRPGSLRELQSLVSGADRLRVLGTGHSFNRLADTTADLVSLAGMPALLELDSTQRTVTVAAQIRYGELGAPLHGLGYALPNLGSLPHISVAGSVATGTHGSGNANGGLATAVRAMQMVTPDGQVATLRRDWGDASENFSGAVVALGALGVVTTLTLDVVPTFEIRQHVYDDLPYKQLLDNFDEVFAAAYSVSVFTSWRDPLRCQVWLKARTDTGADAPPARWLGAALADGPRHPVPGMPPQNCTPQLGEPGPWHERLPHFRLGFTPSSGEELQSEFFVGRGDAVAALQAVAALRESVAPVLQVAEIRTVAADDLWLSPSYRRDSIALHFTWIRDEDAVIPVVAVLETALAPFAPRPHWGKVFTLPPEVVSAQYERAADFAALSRRFDPEGALRNDFVDAFFPRSR
jgi:alditol oxidase